MGHWYCEETTVYRIRYGLYMTKIQVPVSHNILSLRFSYVPYNLYGT